ncbi:MAG: right-handed parallel beta-helix repeat-containing protein [Paludibacteraceae bacterium]|nr:right-handed parallel beta-helix repeat-containing protein [Paludibacteraceae bacterium]
MKRFYFLCMLLITLSLSAQQYIVSDDALERGWWNRPYVRYEAESGHCTTTGVFLTPTDDQRELQSEASHQMAVQLLAKGDYVEWTLDSVGQGITIRFSLPDSENGIGSKGKIRISYTGNSVIPEDMFVYEVTLDSYWAWQYTARNGNYPDNTPSTDKMVRMRFDEVHFCLPLTMMKEKMKTGGRLRLTKIDDNDMPYTIDFVELEAVPEPLSFDDLQAENKVAYNPSTDGDIADFISQNGGKTIYIPAGRHLTKKRIYLNKHNTHLVGAGEWHTEIFFTASSDAADTYSLRGIEGSADNLLVEGLTLNTVNNKRYYQNNDSKQVGKGFMGGWGHNSIIRNCWVEHFECGAWIADYTGEKGSENLLVENCRFRNNYADGINLCQRSTGHLVRYCSFRNNGDDDMASWSTTVRSKNCTFAYCTAENNWRASSLGFFGGENLEAHHLSIVDALECGMRFNADFSGRGFATEGRIYVHDITITHSGCTGGAWGTAGDFWGNMQGAVNIGSTGYYDVNNLYLENINVNDSRTNAFYIRAKSGHKINNLVLKDIAIDQSPGRGIYYSSVSGTARYCNITVTNCKEDENARPSNFKITESCDESAAVSNTEIEKSQTVKQIINNTVYIVKKDKESGYKYYHLTGSEAVVRQE